MFKRHSFHQTAGWVLVLSLFFIFGVATQAVAKPGGEAGTGGGGGIQGPAMPGIFTLGIDPSSCLTSAFTDPYIPGPWDPIDYPSGDPNGMLCTTTLQFAGSCQDLVNYPCTIGSTYPGEDGPIEVKNQGKKKKCKEARRANRLPVFLQRISPDSTSQTEIAVMTPVDLLDDPATEAPEFPDPDPLTFVGAAPPGCWSVGGGETLIISDVNDNRFINPGDGSGIGGKIRMKILVTPSP